MLDSPFLAPSGNRRDFLPFGPQLNSFRVSQPLTGHEVLVSLIGGTTDQGGIGVEVKHDRRQYPKSVKFSKKEIDAWPIEPHDSYGECVVAQKLWTRG